MSTTQDSSFSNGADLNAPVLQVNVSNKNISLSWSIEMSSTFYLPPQTDTLENDMNNPTTEEELIPAAITGFRLSKKVREIGGAWGEWDNNYKTFDESDRSYETTGERGKEYQYSIQALASEIESSWSNTVEAQISYLVPNSPMITNIELENETLVLEWLVESDPEKPIDKIVIRRKRGSSDWVNDYAEVDSLSTLYYDYGITQGETFSYSVKAVGPGGESPWSNIAHRTSALFSPEVPINLSLKRVSNNLFVLNWEYPDAPEKTLEYYEVQRKVDGGSWIDVETTTSTSYNDNTVVSGREYQYRVRSANADTVSQFTEPVSEVNPMGIAIHNESGCNFHPVYVFDGVDWHWRPIYTFEGESAVRKG